MRFMIIWYPYFHNVLPQPKLSRMGISIFSDNKIGNIKHETKTARRISKVSFIITYYEF